MVALVARGRPTAPHRVRDVLGPQGDAPGQVRFGLKIVAIGMLVNLAIGLDGEQHGSVTLGPDSARPTRVSICASVAEVPARSACTWG
jgi:hypothetical protein